MSPKIRSRKGLWHYAGSLQIGIKSFTYCWSINKSVDENFIDLRLQINQVVKQPQCDFGFIDNILKHLIIVISIVTNISENIILMILYAQTLPHIWKIHNWKTYSSYKINFNFNIWAPWPLTKRVPFSKYDKFVLS